MLVPAGFTQDPIPGILCVFLLELSSISSDSANNDGSVIITVLESSREAKTRHQSTDCSRVDDEAGEPH